MTYLLISSLSSVLITHFYAQETPLNPLKSQDHIHLVKKARKLLLKFELSTNPSSFCSYAVLDPVR